RQARVDQARAAYDKNAALYRQTVLNALREVEDNLAAMRILADQRKTQEASVVDARTAEQLAQQQYASGVGSYRGLLAAQTARLNDEVMLLDVRRSRFDASVALIQSLGGGWDVAQ
ncbi:MAG: TolC family protein, partial [Pseudomonadota bacterium]|nr:TolC family protein [Pseudomonadota bacterium]